MKQFKKQVVLSPANFFLIQKGTEMIRLRRGMTKAEVKNLLGEPFSINEGNNPKNLKFVFRMIENSSRSESYEILFREDFLEWSIKIKNK
jgi:hypothetical protein